MPTGPKGEKRQTDVNGMRLPEPSTGWRYGNVEGRTAKGLNSRRGAVTVTFRSAYLSPSDKFKRMRRRRISTPPSR
jgi:hypothetical protein